MQKFFPRESLTLPFEPFRFWLRIRRDIHNRKRLPDSPSRGRGVDKIAYRYNILQNANNIRDNNTELKQALLATTGRQRSRYFFPILELLSDSDTPTRGVGVSPTYQVGESPTHRRKDFSFKNSLVESGSRFLITNIFANTKPKSEGLER